VTAATTAPRGTDLVVDDEESVRASVRAILEETCDVLEAANGAQALDVMKSREIDLVMLDQRMPGEPGIDVLPRIKAADPSTIVVIATAVRELRTAVEALKRGAYDYLTKPFDVDDILMLAQRAFEKRALEREVLYLRSALAGAPSDAGGLAGAFEGMVGRHPEMVRIYQLIVQIASTPTTVLITGESGTGKELVARAIHARSGRASHPFVAINVAAIPDALIESELFGHEKGAFTGAIAKKLGRFELAHGGTIFLDEIGSLRLDLQTKLLRALQEREIERVGGSRAIGVDVRIIAASNADLRQAVTAGRFREDLFYRLHVVPIAVPPLRHRRDDVAPLARHFLAKYARQFGKAVTDLSAGALEALERYHWPGNVRELENIVARSVALTTEGVVQLDQIPLDVALAPAESTGEDQLNLREARQEVERLLILRALDRAQGNQTVAARLLGMHRNTLLVKLAQLGLRATDAGGAQPASSS
jgi:DNA-binding NtrC family response regulator